MCRKITRLIILVYTHLLYLSHLIVLCCFRHLVSGSPGILSLLLSKLVVSADVRTLIWMNTFFVITVATYLIFFALSLSQIRDTCTRSSDPYVIFQMKSGGPSFRSKTIFKNLNPVWGDEVFHFSVNEQSDVLEAKCFDQDTLTKDDPLGHFTINISSLPIGQSFSHTISFFLSSFVATSDCLSSLLCVLVADKKFTLIFRSNRWQMVQVGKRRMRRNQPRAHSGLRNTHTKPLQGTSFLIMKLKPLTNNLLGSLQLTRRWFDVRGWVSREVSNLWNRNIPCQDNLPKQLPRYIHLSTRWIPNKSNDWPIVTASLQAGMRSMTTRLRSLDLDRKQL